MNIDFWMVVLIITSPFWATWLFYLLHKCMENKLKEMYDKAETKNGRLGKF